MKQERGFVLITVLIVVFALSTLGAMRLLTSASRTAEISFYTIDMKLLSLAESGINRAQAEAASDAFLVLNGNEYFLGNGSYEVVGDVIGFTRIVTVNSYIPNKANKDYQKTVVISGTSITNNYTWREK